MSDVNADRTAKPAPVDQLVRWSFHDGNQSIGLRGIWKGWVGDKWLLTVYEKITHSSYQVTGDYNRHIGSSSTCDKAKADAINRAVELGFL